MTTGTILVQDALVQRGVIPENTAPSADQLASGLRWLNRMLDSWSNEISMLYSINTESFPLTAGTASYSTSLLANGRPVSVDFMFVRLSNIDYEVKLVDNQTFNAVTYKPTPSVPSICYYNDGFPNGTFNFYPIPYAAFTCFVDVLRVLSGPITATTDVVMPPGYEKAIVDNLAVYMNYGLAPTQQMLNDARESRAVLKRRNYTPLIMNTGLGGSHSVNNDFPYRGF